MKSRYAFAILIASLVPFSSAFAQKRCDPDDRRCSIEWVNGLKATTSESAKATVQVVNFQPIERPSASEAAMQLFLRLTDDSADPAPRR